MRPRSRERIGRNGSTGPELHHPDRDPGRPRFCGNLDAGHPPTGCGLGADAGDRRCDSARGPSVLAAPVQGDRNHRRPPCGSLRRRDFWAERGEREVGRRGAWFENGGRLRTRCHFLGAVRFHRDASGDSDERSLGGGFHAVLQRRTRDRAPRRRRLGPFDCRTLAGRRFDPLLRLRVWSPPGRGRSTQSHLVHRWVRLRREPRGLVRPTRWRHLHEGRGRGCGFGRQGRSGDPGG